MSGVDELLKELRIHTDAIKEISDELLKATSIKESDKPEQISDKGKTISLESVRKVLAEKSRAGFTAEVKELLMSHGADKLSDVDPSEYAALVKEAEVLGNG